jgi:carboxyl-terminal processing protease
MTRATLALTALCSALGCGGSSWEGGIHARMGHSPEGGLRVVEVPADGPSARAGLAVDDVILAIDGAAVDALTPEQIAGHLRGEVGTTVELRVDRAGRPLTLRIERAPYTD